MERPHLDPGSPEPLYIQIKRWVQEETSAGRWPPRYKLPAEEDLSVFLGVSRGTLRKAIQELIAEGLLLQIHGKGTFVAAAGIEQPLAQELLAFSEHLAQRGISYETVVLRQETHVPPPRVASLLRLGAGQPVLLLERVRLVEGVPVAYMENRVPLYLAPGLEEVDFITQGLFQTLEQRYGLHLNWGNRTFEAIPANSEQAAHLGIAPGAPIFYVEQLVFLADGTPVEQSDVWLRGDRFRMSAVVRRRRAVPDRRKGDPGLAAEKLSF